MRKHRYWLGVELTGAGPAPSEDQIDRVLANSTAAEAIAEGLGCEVRLWLLKPEEISAAGDRLPAIREWLIDHAAAFGRAIMDSTKRQSMNRPASRAIKAERIAAAALLDCIGVNHPTPEEIERCIPG